MLSIRRAAVLAAITASFSAFGCSFRPIDSPSVEAVKGVRVLPYYDPRTLEVFGSVSTVVRVPEQDRLRAYELTIESLKAQALRTHPETAVLFHVKVQHGSDRETWQASGICGKRRGT